MLADIAGHEAANNPDGGPVDSNPYGILALPGGRLVTDAGANALLHLKANGDISPLGVFPSRASGRSTDSVPTAVVAGPDGAYYVAELTGVPFAAGAARIYRVVPGHEPEIVHDGFKTIIDIDFGPDGSLYVLQHATGAFFTGPGQLIRVNPDGARTVVVAGLTRPASVLVDADGTVYLSNRSTSAGTGEVLMVEP
jgi:sugar lactone lactonase YvrE